VESKDDHKLLSYVLDQLIDPEGFFDEVRRLYASVEEESFDLLNFKDGRVFERFSKPQMIGDQIVGRVWSFHDITERINVETDLAESKHRLDIILNSILTGVIIIDAQTHKIVDVNTLAAELIGLPKEEIIDKLCHRFICPAEKGKCPISDLNQTIDQAERVLIKGNGQEIEILKTVTPASWQGHSYYIESFIDITALKEAKKRQDELLERVEKTNQELEDFAYIISHDLKAPLRGINTLATWISTDYADKFDEDGKEQIDLLITRVGRMHDLIEGVLQYSRVGRLREEQVHINLNDLIPEVVDMVCPPDNIKVVVKKELPVIKYERTRIIQVFQNLISNAVKYMDKPEGLVKIDFNDEGGWWVFSISDNGPGIDEKYFDKIFQIFQSVSQQEGFESTGIGLTVTKKIIELYGGKIWLESNPGQGCTFFFSLPKKESEVHDAKYEADNVS
jgi:PAS domain S-box-containing protein